MGIQELLHWGYVALMAIGALYFIGLSRNPRGVPKYEYLVAAFIPIWSGLAYLSMVLPQGELEQGKLEVAGQITHYARYIDWVVTTPLLLLALSWTAMHRSSKNWTLISALMATQVIVIVSGLIADLSTVPWVRYLWYINGVVAFGVVLSLIWGALRSHAKTQGRDLAQLFDKLLTYFTVLWIGYPIAWIIGPSGFGWVIKPQTLCYLRFCPSSRRLGLASSTCTGCAVFRVLNRSESSVLLAALCILLDFLTSGDLALVLTVVDRSASDYEGVAVGLHSSCYLDRHEGSIRDVLV